jgi:hypothetical protein
VPPVGQPVVFVVSTVQLPTVVLTVKPVGNVTLTEVSVAVAAVGDLAHTTPLVNTSPAPPVDCFKRSNLTIVVDIDAALACPKSMGATHWARRTIT